MRFAANAALPVPPATNSAHRLPNCGCCLKCLGAERLIYGKLADAAMIIVRINATDISPKRGDTISLLPQTKYLHWFDAQGARI